MKPDSGSGTWTPSLVSNGEAISDALENDEHLRERSSNCSSRVDEEAWCSGTEYGALELSTEPSEVERDDGVGPGVLVLERVSLRVRSMYRRINIPSSGARRDPADRNHLTFRVVRREYIMTDSRDESDFIKELEFRRRNNQITKIDAASCRSVGGEVESSGDSDLRHKEAMVN
jgi:hypothetical protein